MPGSRAHTLVRTAGQGSPAPPPPAEADPLFAVSAPAMRRVRGMDATSYVTAHPDLPAETPPPPEPQPIPVVSCSPRPMGARFRFAR